MGKVHSEDSCLYQSGVRFQAILFAAYHLQLYGCSIGKYLLNEMSDERRITPVDGGVSGRRTPFSL